MSDDWERVRPVWDTEADGSVGEPRPGSYVILASVACAPAMMLVVCYLAEDLLDSLPETLLIIPMMAFCFLPTILGGAYLALASAAVGLAWWKEEKKVWVICLLAFYTLVLSLPCTFVIWWWVTGNGWGPIIPH